MYRNMINRIEETVSLNFQNADNDDVQRSSFTSGMVKAYADVLRGL